MTFSDLIGNQAVIRQLEQAVAEERLSHALLLVGPDKVGKTTAAVSLAAVLLNSSQWPGGLSAHPDFWLEDSAAERIGIDWVRAQGKTAAHVERIPLQNFLALRSYAGGKQVAVMARAERLTLQAANSLLKIVEEPSAGVHLILTADNPERLPATIVSRCQVFSFAPLQGVAITQWLVSKYEVSDHLASTVAVISGGRPGRARYLATEPGLLEQELATLDEFLALGGKGTVGALRGAEKLAPPMGAVGRERALAQLTTWCSFVRDVACLASGAPELPVWRAYRVALERWAESLPLERVTTILEKFVEAIAQIAQYAMPRLCYEVLFLEIFATASAPPLVMANEREELPVVAAG